MAATPYRIVVGLDFSELAGRALDEALALAAARDGAELHLATVFDGDHLEKTPVEDRHQSLVKIADELRDRLTALGSEARLRAGDRPVPTFAHVRVGPAAEQLASLAAEVGASLVVVGTHGRKGWRRLILGSVAEKTVRLAPCPVLVVRPRDEHAMDAVPALEPPCPQCLETRARTDGAEWWCEAHQSAPLSVHIYSRSQRLDQPRSPAPYGSE